MRPNNQAMRQVRANDAFELAAFSDIGQRAEQQDRLGVQMDDTEMIAVICDGMGGHEGGALASSIAVEHIMGAYRGRGPAADMGWLLRALGEADMEIAARTREDGTPLRAGTTSVTVWIVDGLLHWASVGDSRAYLLRGDEFVQLTKDQTYQIVLEEKRNAGLMTESEYALEKPRGAALISYLGIGGLNLIDYSMSPLRLRSGDRLLVMSDGLYKTIPDERLHALAANFVSGEELLDALDAASRRSAEKAQVSRDNTTVAIITIR